MSITKENHCDNYIHNPKIPKFVRQWLLVQRLPATDKHLLADLVPCVFAMFQHQKVKLIFASRFGWIGINEDLEGTHYVLAVTLNELCDFTQDPRAEVSF